MELSKEEQEAIKNLKLFLQKEENYMTNDKLEIILNLISKLQEKIESQKITLELYCKNYGMHKDKLEKQSKVIDEMADLISCECQDDWIVELYNIADGNIKELVKQYFYGKVEDNDGFI